MGYIKRRYPLLKFTNDILKFNSNYKIWLDNRLFWWSYIICFKKKGFSN